jgi:hypothetical protein
MHQSSPAAFQGNDLPRPRPRPRLRPRPRRPATASPLHPRCRAPDSQSRRPGELRRGGTGHRQRQQHQPVEGRKGGRVEGKRVFSVLPSIFGPLGASDPVGFVSPAMHHSHSPGWRAPSGISVPTTSLIPHSPSHPTRPEQRCAAPRASTFPPFRPRHNVRLLYLGMGVFSLLLLSPRPFSRPSFFSPINLHAVHVY